MYPHWTIYSVTVIKPTAHPTAVLLFTINQLLSRSTLLLASAPHLSLRPTSRQNSLIFHFLEKIRPEKWHLHVPKAHFISLLPFILDLTYIQYIHSPHNGGFARRQRWNLSRRLPNHEAILIDQVCARERITETVNSAHVRPYTIAFTVQ